MLHSVTWIFYFHIDILSISRFHVCFIINEMFFLLFSIDRRYGKFS